MIRVVCGFLVCMSAGVTRLLAHLRPWENWICDFAFMIGFAAFVISIYQTGRQS
jgi:hypothetical protein